MHRLLRSRLAVVLVFGVTLLAQLSSAAATLEYFQMRLEDVEARMIPRVGDQCD